MLHNDVLAQLRLQICGQIYGRKHNGPASVYVRITPYAEMRMRSAISSCVLRIAYVRISYPWFSTSESQSCGEARAPRRAASTEWVDREWLSLHMKLVHGHRPSAVFDV